MLQAVEHRQSIIGIRDKYARLESRKLPTMNKRVQNFIYKNIDNINTCDNDLSEQANVLSLLILPIILLWI